MKTKNTNKLKSCPTIKQLIREDIIKQLIREDIKYLKAIQSLNIREYPQSEFIIEDSRVLNSNCFNEFIY